MNDILSPVSLAGLEKKLGTVKMFKPEILIVAFDVDRLDKGVGRMWTPDLNYIKSKLAMVLELIAIGSLIIELKKELLLIKILVLTSYRKFHHPIPEG